MAIDSRLNSAVEFAKFPGLRKAGARSARWPLRYAIPFWFVLAAAMWAAIVWAILAIFD